jgi:hypothetical protein
MDALKAKVTCFLCQDILSNPKRLPCRHVYCSQCLHGVLTSEALTCPQCNLEVPLDDGGITTLPTPHAEMRFIAAYEEMSRSPPATPQPVKKCMAHSTEPLSIYCGTCGELVCRECVILYCAKHNHNYNKVEVAVKAFQEELAGQNLELSTLYEQASAVLVKLSVSDLNLKHEEMLQTVVSTFQSLVDTLEGERSRCINSISSFFEEQKKQKTYLTSKVKDIVKNLQSILQALPTSHSNPLIDDLVALRERIKLVRSTWQTIAHKQIDFPEVEMDVCTPSGLQTFLDERIRVFTNECHLLSYVKDFDFDSVPVNESSEVRIHLLQNDLESYLEKVDIQFELVCAYNDLSEELTVTEVDSATYSCRIVPQRRGRHHLKMLYNGKHICGSPISLFATLSPNKLAHVSPTIQEVDKIVSMTFYDGKFYVTEDDVALRVVDISSMTEERRFPVQSILEIAISADYYYATVKRNTVVQMDTKGVVLKTIGKGGCLPGEFNIVNSVSLWGGEVYICDTGNDRVQVFDEDLNFVRSFGVSGQGRNMLSKPDNVVFDEEGNLYVVEEGNHRVQVFTPMCHHVRFIGSYGSGDGQLDQPVAAAIFRELVFVVEFGNKRVSVFTKAGEFVSTFADGLFSEPDNIVVDDHGYIYVADNRSKLFIF